MKIGVEDLLLNGNVIRVVWRYFKIIIKIHWSSIVEENYCPVEIGKGKEDNSFFN